MKKAIKWIALVVVLLIVGGLAVAWFSLNGIVRTQVEKASTKSLKTRTTLAAANVSPFAGTVSLSDLDIASPEGFAAPEIFSLGNVAVDVKYGELRKDPVRIQSITLQKPRLVLEMKGTKLNVKALMDNLNDPNAPAPEADAEPMKLIIDQLKVDGAEVVIRPGIPGLKDEITLNVPSITMSNIGNAEGNANGEEIGRVAMDVMGALAKSAANSDQLPEEVRAILNLNVDQLVKDLSAKAQAEISKVTEQVEANISKATEDLTKKADEVKTDVTNQIDEAQKDVQNKAEKGLNDLLGGKKKDEKKEEEKNAEEKK